MNSVPPGEIFLVDLLLLILKSLINALCPLVHLFSSHFDLRCSSNVNEIEDVDEFLQFLRRRREWDQRMEGRRNLRAFIFLFVGVMIQLFEVDLMIFFVASKILFDRFPFEGEQARTNRFIDNDRVSELPAEEIIGQVKIPSPRRRETDRRVDAFSYWTSSTIVWYLMNRVRALKLSMFSRKSRRSKYWRRTTNEERREGEGRILEVW